MNAFVLEFRLTWCQERNQNESGSDWAPWKAQEGRLAGSGLMRPWERAASRNIYEKQLWPGSLCIKIQQWLKAAQANY